jgi:1-deoxy-D-xylulose-5-phosphate synthase
VVAITAAMAEPTGVDRLARHRPGRVFDVGIAEQHAVTSAAGMAMAGLHPVVAVYATFLNRAFDQVLLDVGLHRLPVTLVVDRAGVTGPDGPSHHGLWDLALLQLVPAIRVAAPRDADTLREELSEALNVDDGITAVRFPRGRPAAAIPRLARLGGPGGVDVLRAGGPHPHVLVVGVGGVLGDCLAAAELAAASGVRVSVVDPRWVVPVNPLLAELARGARAVVTVEDGIVASGVGAATARAFAEQGVAVPVRSIGLPRRFLPHGPRRDLLATHGLAPQPLARVLLEAAGARPAHGLGWRDRAARRRRERAAR